MTTLIERRTALAISEPTYWREIALNTAFQQRLYIEQLGCLTCDELRREGSADTGLSRTFRIMRPVTGPAVIRKIFGATTTVEERSRFDPHSRTIEYHVVPATLADRIHIRGSVYLESADDGIVEVMRRSVRCDVFGLGAVMERFAASTYEQGDVERERYLRRYIETCSLT